MCEHHANMVVSLPSHPEASKQMAQKRGLALAEVVRPMYSDWLGPLERSMTFVTTALQSCWLGTTQVEHEVGLKVEADHKKDNIWWLVPFLAAEQ